MTGAIIPKPGSAVTASECAPQPWSRETTRPSSGAYSFAHTPNTRPSGPDSDVRNPQVTHGPGAARASGVPGPCSLEYQRRAVVSRPMADSTRALPGRGGGTSSLSSSARPRLTASSRPSSNTCQPALSSQSRTPSSPSSTAAGTSRSSSEEAGMRSPTPRSPGRTRSLHGTQSGASSDYGPGSSTTSLTVTALAREARLTVTAQRQPV